MVESVIDTKQKKKKKIKKKNPNTKIKQFQIFKIKSNYSIEFILNFKTIITQKKSFKLNLN